MKRRFNLRLKTKSNSESKGNKKKGLFSFFDIDSTFCWFFSGAVRYILAAGIVRIIKKGIVG